MSVSTFCVEGDRGDVRGELRGEAAAVSGHWSLKAGFTKCTGSDRPTVSLAAARNAVTGPAWYQTHTVAYAQELGAVRRSTAWSS